MRLGGQSEEPESQVEGLGEVGPHLGENVTTRGRDTQAGWAVLGQGCQTGTCAQRLWWGHHPEAKGRDLPGPVSSDVSGAAWPESRGHGAAKGQGPGPGQLGSYNHRR